MVPVEAQALLALQVALREIEGLPAHTLAPHFRPLPRIRPLGFTSHGVLQQPE